LKAAADALFKSGAPLATNDAVIDPIKAAAEALFKKK
jgi:uncharacterized small protein (DUF1192 family)